MWYHVPMSNISDDNDDISPNGDYANLGQSLYAPKKAARFIPGVPGPGSGRPRSPHVATPATPAEVRALLFMVLDEKTANQMIISLRRKIAKGNVTVLEFLFDRIIGRPAVNVHHDMDGALAQFMASWQTLVAGATLDEPGTLADDGDAVTIDGQVTVIDDDDDEDE
jgi:hypothetical protein